MSRGSIHDIEILANKCAIFIFFIHHNIVEKEHRKIQQQKRKHIRTHTWTTVSDAKAVNKVKQRNYNDYTESRSIVAIHNKLPRLFLPSVSAKAPRAAEPTAT